MTPARLRVFRVPRGLPVADRRAFQHLGVMSGDLHDHVYSELCSVQPDGSITEFPSDFKFQAGTMVLEYGGVVFDKLKWEEDADCRGVTMDGVLPRNSRVLLRLTYQLAE